MLQLTRSKQVSEEIVMDVFSKLWAGRELVQEIGNMDAFLYRVARNKAMDFFKIAARDRRIQNLIAREMAAGGSEPADRMIMDSEIQQIFNDAVQRLSPQRKLIFVMSRQQGLSNEDIARQLSLSPSTIKNTIKDASAIIVKYISKYNHGKFLLPLISLISSGQI